MVVHTNPSAPSTQYEQWEAMRGGDLVMPRAAADIEFYVNHIAELKNTQFKECHPSTGLTVQDIEVPVSYSHNEVKIHGDPFLDTTTKLLSEAKSGETIPVRVYRPSIGNGPYPLIIWFHGGGYLAGDLSTEDAACRNISRLANSVVLNVAYRTLSYPTPFRDGWDVVLWAIANCSMLLQASPHRGFYIGGSSCGAHLATTLALHASSIGLNPPFTGQVLRSPVTLHPSTPIGQLPSMEKSHPLVTKEHIEYWWSVYNPPQHLISSPSVSPLLAELNTLPPSYLQITTADPHADEGLKYAEKLRQTGVPVRVTTYQGEPHTFWDLPRIKGAATAMQDLIDGLRWLQQHEQLDLDQWDTGIREQTARWLEDSQSGEGEAAWKRKKLCHVTGCACYL